MKRADCNGSESEEIHDSRRKSGCNKEGARRFGFTGVMVEEAVHEQLTAQVAHAVERDGEGDG